MAIHFRQLLFMNSFFCISASIDEIFDFFFSFFILYKMYFYHIISPNSFQIPPNFMFSLSLSLEKKKDRNKSKQTKILKNLWVWQKYINQTKITLQDRTQEVVLRQNVLHSVLSSVLYCIHSCRCAKYSVCCLNWDSSHS